MTAPKKKPKRRNAPKTRAKILAAAQKAFAAHGYAEVGIRDIAELAGISSPMLLRYFGSKAGLFETALIEAMPLDDLLLHTQRDKLGELLVSQFVDADLYLPSPSIIALSTGHADARDIATRITEAHIVEPLAKWLGPPDARVRALKIVMLAMGFLICTRQLPLMSVQKGVDKTLAAWFAKTLQAIVDQT
jgi:AcrR family transcriptional regulator